MFESRLIQTHQVSINFTPIPKRTVDLNAQSANLQPNHAGTLVLICGTYWSSFAFNYAASPWLLQKTCWAEKTAYSIRSVGEREVAYVEVAPQRWRRPAAQHMRWGIRPHVPPAQLMFSTCHTCIVSSRRVRRIYFYVCVQTSGVMFCRCRCQPVEESTCTGC